MLTENYSVFFNADDFAQTAVYDAVDVGGIFTAETKELFEGKLYVQDATFICATSAGLTLDTDIAIDGNSYLIKEVKPDGTGVTEATLALIGAYVAPSAYYTMDSNLISADSTLITSDQAA